MDVKKPKQKSMGLGKIYKMLDKHQPYLEIKTDELGDHLTWTDNAVMTLSANKIREIREEARKNGIRLLIHENILPVLIERMEQR